MRSDDGSRWQPGLTPDELAMLKQLSRDTLVWCVTPDAGAFGFDAYAIGGGLTVEMATFVTLTVQGQLRGCIGTLAPQEALFLSVHHNTRNAAREDFRFPAVTAEEVAGIDIHISLLGPVHEIATLDVFQPGRDGIILSLRGRRAVFLPEVAVDQGWSREETARHLCRKAGLPDHEWRDGGRFSVFQTFGFDV